MTTIYYTQNLRDLFWVRPIWEETGGAFCSELEETGRQFLAHDPTLPFTHIRTARKWTIGRGVESGRHQLKTKTVRLRLAQIARRLRPDVIVTTSNHRHAIRRDIAGRLWQGGATYPRVKQVQAFHGVSSKNVKFNPWMAEYDLLLLPGRRERDKFTELGILDRVPHALIGHPKADRVLRGELTQATARAALGLPDRPTVLYAPTHGALSSLPRWGLEICRAVPDDCNLIVKPHPSLLVTLRAEGAGQKLLDEMTALLQGRGALWLPHEPDVMPAMAASDILITDYSSVAEEYLVFDRPLVFADHLAGANGRDRAQRDKGDWDALFATGTRVTQSGALREAIEHALSHADEHRAARQKMRGYVFENLDGHCAARAAAAITRIVGG